MRIRVLRIVELLVGAARSGVQRVFVQSQKRLGPMRRCQIATSLGGCSASFILLAKIWQRGHDAVFAVSNQPDVPPSG
jgi:hypothetical protein